MSSIVRLYESHSEQKQDILPLQLAALAGQELTRPAQQCDMNGAL